jgi:hypothetical protein
MLKETAAAAVAKLRTDLPDVTSRDLGAAQSAMGVRARGAVIDKNEAQHIGPPPGTGFLVKRGVIFIATFCWEDSLRRMAIPAIAI